MRFMRGRRERPVCSQIGRFEGAIGFGVGDRWVFGFGWFLEITACG